MDRVREVFGTAPVLLPVVHPISRAAALTAVGVARAVGAPGVFLIDQGMTEREVLALAREVREQHPALWIGVNLLGRAPLETLRIALEFPTVIDGIWTDDARVYAEGAAVDAQAFSLLRVGWRGLYFGGVAFKYQRPIAQDDLRRVAMIASPHMDVVCTSGPGTGLAADVAKVRALRSGLGDHALALASGVTAHNVRDYLPHVQAFLVGTGIESRLGVLDPAKLEALRAAMQGAS